MSSTVMAMHQANYIPWLGYFSKMLHSDVFVLLDVVQYPRGQSFSPRNRIKTPNGSSFLTIPLSVPGGKDGKALYTEVAFAGDKWKKKHLKTLELGYKKAPFFEEVYALVEKEIQQQPSFIDLNIGLIQAVASYLDIETKCVRLSEILTDFGQKTDLIIDICREVDANTYLSGTGGGREYNNEQQLDDAGIKLLYSKFEHPEYSQLWGDFISHLSIVDALFMCGKETRGLLVNDG
ncbi:MAG: WbqC family protein [Calditrichia bacterium]